MADSKKTPFELAVEKWCATAKEIHEQEHRLNSTLGNYSSDFQFLCNAILESPVDTDGVKYALARLSNCKKDLPSDTFKTAVSLFISGCTYTIYKKPEEAHKILKKTGWKPIRPERFTPPTPPKPQQERQRYFYDEPIKQKRRFRFSSIFDWIDSKFDELKYWLNNIYDYLDHHDLAIWIIIIGFWLFVIYFAVMAFIQGRTFDGIVMIILGSTFTVVIACVGVIANEILKYILKFIQLVFYRWWSFLLAVCTVLAAIYIPPYIKQYQDNVHYNEIMQIVEEYENDNRFVEAADELIKAAEFNEALHDSLLQASEMLKYHADTLITSLNKKIGTDLYKVRKQRKSKSGFQDELWAIQDMIDIILKNDAENKKAAQHQKTLNQLWKLKTGHTAPPARPQQDTTITVFDTN